MASKKRNRKWFILGGVAIAGIAGALFARYVLGWGSNVPPTYMPLTIKQAGQITSTSLSLSVINSSSIFINYRILERQSGMESSAFWSISPNATQDITAQISLPVTQNMADLLAVDDVDKTIKLSPDIIVQIPSG